MTIYEMVHLVQAASYITKKDTFLIVGSQAVLGNYLNEAGSFEFARSREIDIVIKETESEIADILEGVFGEASYFEKTHGIYIDVVDIKTCTLPDDWEKRLIQKKYKDGPLLRFLSPEDLAFTKYAAWREKDKIFLAKMWREQLLDIEKMRKLWHTLPKDKFSFIQSRFERQYSESQDVGAPDDPGMHP